MKKILSLVLALVLLLGVANFSVAEDEPMVITIFGGDTGTGNTSFTDEEGNFPAYRSIEEKFNVNLVFNSSPSYGSVVSTRLAAGTDLEDLFCIAYEDFTKYEDLFRPLDDLIEEYAPDLQAFYAINPAARSYNVDPNNGKQWAFSESEYYYKDIGDCFAWTIRQDWLDKLGMPVPTTLDELYDTLKAFQDNTDLLGCTRPCIVSGHFSYIAAMFGNCWGMPGLYEGYVYADENGQVVFGQCTEDYKELLTFMNKLYTEDLLDPMYPNCNDESQNNVIASNNAALLAKQSSCLDQVLPYYIAADENVKLSVLDVLEGPTGKKVQFACPTEWKRYIIPATVSDEKAAKIMEIVNYIMATKQGYDEHWYGVEGETFYYDEEGIPVYFDEIRFAGDATVWKDLGLQNQVVPNVYHALSKYDCDAWYWDIYDQTVTLSSNMTPGNFFQKNAYTEEIRELTRKPDLGTYISEMTSKFILGEANIEEEWDTYMATCLELGLEEKITGLQMAYDLYN